MLVITRKADESIHIGDGVEIVVLEIVKDKVKIGVKAPRDVKVMRSELLA
ncbi:MAG: carbon storage regulator, partial [Oscillospiraceae bacterium]|nr:carbon storage regulator [Oscillospiraceae bacterium]